MVEYHDKEWGRASHDDHHLFEMLILEGAQAGLSWSTVLAKRENYRRALDGFDVEAVANYSPSKLDQLLADPGIIRNRLKIAATVKNARSFIAVATEFDTFGKYLWDFVDGSPIVNRPSPEEPPVARTELSDRLSKDMKRRDFTFVGSTIAYAYLQSVGVVNDHVQGCDVLVEMNL